MSDAPALEQGYLLCSRASVWLCPALLPAAAIKVVAVSVEADSLSRPIVPGLTDRVGILAKGGRIQFAGVY